MIGALDRKWAAEDDGRNALRLDEAAKRIAASEEVMQSFMAPLAAKIEHAAAAAEAAVRNDTTCFQRVSEHHWHDFRGFQIRAASGDSSALKRTH